MTKIHPRPKYIQNSFVSEILNYSDLKAFQLQISRKQHCFEAFTILVSPDTVVLIFAEVMEEPQTIYDLLGLYKTKY